MQKRNEIWPAAMPPRIEEVRIYFSQKGMNEKEAETFFLFYQFKQWRSKKGNLFRSWKGIAHGWIASALRSEPWLFNKNVH